MDMVIRSSLPILAEKLYHGQLSHAPFFDILSVPASHCQKKLMFLCK